MTDKQQLAFYVYFLHTLRYFKSTLQKRWLYAMSFSANLTILASIHLLIHLSTHLSHPCSHHPSLLHSFTPGSKPGVLRLNKSFPP